LAVLRTLLGFQVKEFNSIAGCSESYVQSIELGRRPLTDDRALAVSLKTGVSIEWLLNGHPTEPPVSTWGEPYTVAIYQAVRRRDRDRLTSHDKSPRGIEAKKGAMYVAACDLAYLYGQTNDYTTLWLAHFKVKKALAKVRVEMGFGEMDQMPDLAEFCDDLQSGYWVAYAAIEKEDALKKAASKTSRPRKARRARGSARKP
jgi:transcriptional regulator with XRE-family HTH domain